MVFSMNDFVATVDKIINSEAVDFIDLVEDSGLDISTDLIGIELSNVNFNGSKFCSYNFKLSNFNNCDFVDCVFDNTNISLAAFFKCTFENCIFLKVDFEYTSFRKTNFSECNINHSILRMSHFERSKFSSTQISNSDFSRSKVYDSLLNGLTLFSTNMRSTQMVSNGGISVGFKMELENNGAIITTDGRPSEDSSKKDDRAA